MATPIEFLQEAQQQTRDGRWIPARPIPCGSLWWRFRDAWLVFTLRAEAVVWPAESRA